ncbi:MAG: class II aldolase/adducin family protein [Rhodospirillaceae bacterium]|nr:class II aldolase/adducin family protein [Rhodospirillaceae bacterium]
MTEALANTVRLAGRALSRAGLVHAYGHCSARLNATTFLVSPAKPLGHVGRGETCSVVSIEGPLPEGVLGEVRIHREIYRLRPDVNGIVRSMPPKAMSLGTLKRTPQPRHGFGSYFHAGIPLWDDPQLLRDDTQARKLAEHFGQARGLIMRGNGVVTAGVSLEEAVVLTWYLEDAARVELDCMAAGHTDVGVLSPDEAAARATWSGRILERMWDHLTYGDPERTA